MLSLQYFSHLMGRADLLEKTLMHGKIEGRRRRGQQRMRWLNGITDSMDMNLSKLWGTVKDRKAWHVAVHGATKIWTWLSEWTTWQKNQGKKNRFTFMYSECPPHKPASCEISKMRTWVCMSNLCKLVHMSGIHCHVCASSTSGCFFLYFTV